MLARLNLVIVTLWVGALWMTGLTAYVLFDNLQDKQLAGSLAGKLFNIVSYIGLASAFYLLIQRLLDYGTSVLKQSYFWAIIIDVAVDFSQSFWCSANIGPSKSQRNAE